LTPQIASHWVDDPDLFSRTFPMDLRPQGPEIIRTWLFSTLLRAQLEHGSLPWAHASINGWILDPDRKKMSKSKGNVVTPAALVDEHGADGVRYWACQAGLGVDTATDAAQMKNGRRLAIKLLNASKFVLGLGVDAGGADVAAVTQPIDRSMLAQLQTVVASATTAFEGYQYQRALEHTETFFWSFCDDYVELVKSRAYGSDAPSASARAALAAALATLQRLLAPIAPFTAEEVWSWWQDGSIHRQSWPSEDELTAATDGADPAVLEVAAAVLGEIRKAKSTAKRNMRTQVLSLEVADRSDRLDVLAMAEQDLREAGNVVEMTCRVADELAVGVVLAPADAEGTAGTSRRAD